MAVRRRLRLSSGKVRLVLSSSVKERAFHAARRRGVSYGELLALVVTRVFDEGLLGAVLDDGVDDTARQDRERGLQ